MVRILKGSTKHSIERTISAINEGGSLQVYNQYTSVAETYRSSIKVLACTIIGHYGAQVFKHSVHVQVDTKSRKRSPSRHITKYINSSSLEHCLSTTFLA